MKVQLIESKFSLLSPFNTVIAFISPKQLGTHELCDKNHNPYLSKTSWDMPAIAVVGYENDDLYKTVKNYSLLENIKYGDLGVIDGHHRLEASLIKKRKIIPIQIFPYRTNKMIISTWLKNFIPLKVAEVVKHFKVSNNHIPSKATKHLIIGTDGAKYKISKVQPRIKIKSRFLA